MKTTRFLACLPLENVLRSSPFPIEGCEVKDADIPLQTTRRLYKSQNHARRARQIGKAEAAAKRRCGIPRRIDDKSPRASELRDLKRVQNRITQELKSKAQALMRNRRRLI